MTRYQGGASEDLKISAENLNRLDSRQGDLYESRIALIREFIKASSKDTAPELSWVDKLRAVYSLSTPGSYTFSDSDERCEQESLASLFDSLSVYEKLEICRELKRCIKPPSDPLQLLLYANDATTGETLTDSSVSGRIAYMKNNFTESAFLRFSRLTQNPRSAYLQSFDAVCEEVYSGRSEYCILPIESSSEGRLNSFYSMIDRYELKIAAVCIVVHHDSQKFTKFALLSKSISSHISHSGNKDLILEFRFTASEGGLSPLIEILSAAKACDLKLQRLDSLPLPYNDEMLSYYLSFNTGGSDLIPFLTFITLEFPQCDPLGVYFTVK